MTLVVGVVTPNGAVIGADGLATWSGTFQSPTSKLSLIGKCFAVGIAGQGTLGGVLATALQASALATAEPATLTKAAATTLARQVIRDAILEYVKLIAFNNQRPLTEQVGEVGLLVVGLCSDGPLLLFLDQTGNIFTPASPNYHAIGGAGLSALLLLRAYSRYDFASHPLETSVLLVKRVLEMIAAAVPGIGGTLSVTAISPTADADGRYAATVDLNSKKIIDSMATWELLEEEMFATLAGSVTQSPKEATAVEEAAAAASPVIQIVDFST